MDLTTETVSNAYERSRRGTSDYADDGPMLLEADSAAGALTGDDDDDGGEVELDAQGTGLWQSVLLFALAVLVIEGQVLFVSCVFNVILRQLVLPKGIAFQRPFHPDYQLPQPAALVPILDDRFLTSGQLLQEAPPGDSGLMVREGSYFDVWLKIALPYSEENSPLFQVQVDLLAPNASVLFTARKNCLMKKENAVLKYAKMAFYWPLYLFGFADNSDETLYLPVVSRFKQGHIENVGEAKVAQLRVSFLPQRDKPPPEIYSAEAHILVKLSRVQHFMYHYPVTSFAMLTGATATVVNGLLLGLLVFVLLFLLLGSSAEGRENDGDGDGDEGTEVSEGGEDGPSASEKEGLRGEGIVDVDGAGAWDAGEEGASGSELSSGLNLEFHDDGDGGRGGGAEGAGPATSSLSDASSGPESGNETTRVVKAPKQPNISFVRSRRA